MAKERQRLTADLNELFPGDTIKIGEQTLHIIPLRAGQIAKIVRKLKALTETLKTEGVTWDNYNEPEHLLNTATVIITDFPELLEECTNIDKDDLQELPIEIIVELLDKVIEVNMAAKDSLVGNFTSLMGRFSGILATEETKTTESSEPSKNS